MQQRRIRVLKREPIVRISWPQQMCRVKRLASAVGVFEELSSAMRLPKVTYHLMKGELSSDNSLPMRKSLLSFCFSATDENSILDSF